jgi:hypothetical protein
MGISPGSRWASCDGLVLVKRSFLDGTDIRVIGGASCMCIAISVAEIVSAYPVFSPTLI